MRELSLFSGAGGGLLGTKLLGWENVGYVEFNDYCQQILKQRIKDGYLDEAPIFSDIRAFNSEGYAASYKGLVDVITAGFPCQPFSNSGKKRGPDDPRNMWPATLQCISMVRPRYCLLENVPGLFTSGYYGTILGGLAEIGYCDRWEIISADQIGAQHERKRVWIVAYPNSSRKLQSTEKGNKSRVGISKCSENVENSTSGRFEKLREEHKASIDIDKSSQIGTWPRWPIEPGMGRMVNGVAHRVDRIAALGNGQVPRVVVAACETLMNRKKPINRSLIYE